MHFDFQSAPAPAGDGSWKWRYDRGSRARAEQHVQEPAEPVQAPDDVGEVMNPLWDDFAAIDRPMMLVRGSLSPVVDSFLGVVRSMLRAAGRWIRDLGSSIQLGPDNEQVTGRETGART